MENTFGFVQAVQQVIIDPGPSSLWPLFLSSFLNDLVGIFPYALAIAGQLVFLKGAFSLALAAKLLVFVAVPIGLGSAMGSMPLYVGAYFGGKPVINKFQKYLHFRWEDVEKLNVRFRGTWYDDAIFLLLRCTPVLPSFPLDVIGGTLRMGFWPFFVLTAVGSIIRMMVTLLVVGISMHSLLQL